MLTPSELADTQKLQTLDMQYYRVPLQYDTTPTEQDFDDLMTVIRKHGFSEEYERNKTAIVYYCRTGKSRTTLALAVTGLVMCHLRVKHHLKYIYRCNTIWSNFDFYENEERIFEIIV